MGQKNKTTPITGLNLDSLTINGEGELEVEFDLSDPQTTDHWLEQRTGTRTFDIDDDKELGLACRKVFQIVRERMREPDEEIQEIDCDKCAKSFCCREYNVLVTDADVALLAEGLNMPASAVEQEFTEEGIDWTGDYRLQMRKDEDQDGEEKCMFLKQNSDGLWRCSVYNNRPQICRSYDMKTCDIFESIDDQD